MHDLEQLIREKQDQLRGRPLYWWERVLEQFRPRDWFMISIALLLLVWIIAR